jgi:hypothetical protein
MLIGTLRADYQKDVKVICSFYTKLNYGKIIEDE